MQTETKIDEITLDGLRELFDKQKSENEKILKASMSDFEDKIKTTYRIGETVKTAEVVPAATTKVETAKMSGIMDSFSSINWKDIAVGGFVSMVGTELVDGFLAKQNVYVRAGAKVAAAILIGKFIKKIGFIGDGGAKVIVTLMVFDALRDAIPINTMVQGITGKVTGIVANKGLAGPGKMSYVPNAVANYYSRAQGR